MLKEIFDYCVVIIKIEYFWKESPLSLICKRKSFSLQENLFREVSDFVSWWQNFFLGVFTLMREGRKARLVMDHGHVFHSITRFKTYE